MKLPKDITIILAAGHGAGDSGAASPDGKHNERDQAITIVDFARERLFNLGYYVTVAPHKHDTHESIAWLNKNFRWGQAWAFELHRDSASTIKGNEASFRCGVYHGSSTLSKSLAEQLVDGFKKSGATEKSWARNQNVSRHGRLGWIAQPECLSHLVELGFMEGNNDASHMSVLADIFVQGLHRVMKANT